MRARGFTLIELLIVIGIIGIIAAAILVAVDPAKRFAQSRDARRAAETYSILNAVLNYTADHVGTLPSAIDGDSSSAQVLGTAASGCNVGCSPAGTTTVACADLTSDLVDTYIAKTPDPRRTNGSVTYDNLRTGYYVNRTATGRVMIGSCNPELVSDISVQR